MKRVYRGFFMALALCSTVGCIVLPDASSEGVSDPSGDPPGEEVSFNPLGYVGAEHNKLLACLMAGGEATVEELLIRQVENCGFDPGTDRASYVEAYRPYVPTSPMTLSEYVDTYIAAGTYDAEQRALIDELSAVLADEDSPLETLERLQSLEESAVEALGRSDQDMSILAGLAIATDSTVFWTRLDPSTGSATPRRAKWWWIVAGDALGGIVGCLLGGVTGTVGLGSATSAAVGLYADQAFPDGDGDDMCVLDTQDIPCLACGKEQCCFELQACIADIACACAYTCALEGGDPMECQSTCGGHEFCGG